MFRFLSRAQRIAIASGAAIGVSLLAFPQAAIADGPIEVTNLSFALACDNYALELDGVSVTADTKFSKTALPINVGVLRNGENESHTNISISAPGGPYVSSVIDATVGDHFDLWVQSESNVVGSYVVPETACSTPGDSIIDDGPGSTVATFSDSYIEPETSGNVSFRTTLRSLIGYPQDVTVWASITRDSESVFFEEYDIVVGETLDIELPWETVPDDLFVSLAGVIGGGGSDGIGNIVRSPVSVLAPPTPALVVDRVSGSDRYQTAVDISKAAYPAKASVVYVANGGNYPDALAAGPVAAHVGGPLLLTDTNTLVPSVAAEIERLAPTKIIIVGGTGSVSEKVATQLKALKSKSNVVRIGGTDRYDTGRLLIDDSFDTAPSAYVATGTNFPDALSAGPAASSKGGPVVLVSGGAGTIDQPTNKLFSSLAPNTISIAGGNGSVSQGIEISLRAIAPTDRQAGASRYDTSTAINKAAIKSSDRAFLATGVNFPDALAASAWAGALSAPLYVVPGNCVPQGTLDTMKAQGVNHITLIGGVNSLNKSVEALKPCE
ncbi:MAG: cell wall-binding repeat-containing protein [Beijerinckiaceae bacterium]|nr:cell wall-binding repeat-containing protein [Beijerinckiaceae bacterium]